MRSEKVKQMTIDAMFLAIMALMTFVPELGFISIGGVVSFTILHIVVLIGASLYDWKHAILYGFMFGMLSFIKSITLPESILDPYFANPLVSVLPRTFFGLISGLAIGFSKKIKGNIWPLVLLPFICFIATMLHGIMTLTCLGVFGDINALNGTFENGYWVTMWATIGSGTTIEAAAAAVIVLPITFAINVSTKKISQEELKSTTDRSELLGKIGCGLAVLPIASMIIGSIGFSFAKIFENEKGKKINRLAMILCCVSTVIWAVTIILCCVL